ncbi:TIGR00725 family protein [Cohaesibacter celericrescens]|uniref:TIGR00725 family protein n=1 Tax=Cohaesibacter celericrescens TaxID=2067669 RepID=A0A2N5XVL9_9HYPH|nr:TIGR00725 family protein [Cohaesibacter celericrescens]PLW78561.1 TIGR00725 family protein [Cohaesibacter celericrescens]
MNFRVDDGCLIDESGARLDERHWRWNPKVVADCDDRIEHLPQLAPLDAVQYVYGRPTARRLPIGVIGPNEPTKDMCEAAEKLGRALAKLNVPILCGGRGGVMEAASRGAYEEGGQILGFLRGDDWRDANDYVTFPLATGIGHARNAIIAQSSLALVAVGGQYGTHSEAAFGLNFGKQVFGLCQAPDIDGVQHLETVESAINALVPILLHLR